MTNTSDVLSKLMIVGLALVAVGCAGQAVVASPGTEAPPRTVIVIQTAAPTTTEVTTTSTTLPASSTTTATTATTTATPTTTTRVAPSTPPPTTERVTIPPTTAPSCPESWPTISLQLGNDEVMRVTISNPFDRPILIYAETWTDNNALQPEHRFNPPMRLDAFQSFTTYDSAAGAVRGHLQSRVSSWDVATPPPCFVKFGPWSPGP